MMKQMILLALAGTVVADIEVSRTVTSVESGLSAVISVGPDGTCTGSDEYGSNDCTMDWSTNYTVGYNATVPKDIDASYKLNVDLKIDSIFPFSFSCAACGTDCTITIPVISQTVTIPALPCPLVAAGNVAGNAVIPLPASAVPLKVSFSGTVSIVDSTGANAAVVSVSGSASP